MQGLTPEQKVKVSQSIPGLGVKGSGNSAGEIIDSLFRLGGKIITYTSNAVANTQDTVAHGLGYVPQGYIDIGANTAGILYNSQAADANNLYLKSSVASTTYTILVF